MGGWSSPIGLKSNQKSTFFSAFEDDFCSENENSPQRNWGAEVVKDLVLFGLEKWSFFVEDLTELW